MELPSQRIDVFCIGFSFHATIPRNIIVNSIRISSFIAFVMFPIICNQIVQTKAIMTSNEIDAMTRSISTFRVEIEISSNGFGKLTNLSKETHICPNYREFVFPYHTRSAFDKVTDCISKLTVPFQPTISKSVHKL
jgi:hypothetical protein